MATFSSVASFICTPPATKSFNQVINFTTSATKMPINNQISSSLKIIGNNIGHWSKNGFPESLGIISTKRTCRFQVSCSTIMERVVKIVVEQLGVKKEEVTPNASFVEDLGADSLDLVELVMAFEQEFDIEVPDEEAEKITTVQEAVDFIASQVQ